MVDDLIHALIQSSKTLVLTGAGISTGSGVPDFSADMGALWERIYSYGIFPEMAFFEKSAESACKYWLSFTLPMLDARPNIIHHTIALMEHFGLVAAVLTTNTDRLHQKGGSLKVHELHSHMENAICDRCQKTQPIETIVAKIESGEIPPRCPVCHQGGLMPDVMLGYQRSQDYDMALNETQDADLLLIIGASSILNHDYIKAIPDTLKRNGKPVWILNGTPSPYDEQADRTIITDLTAFMKVFSQRLSDYLC